MLYHLLTGQYPFRAETMTDIERQHLEAPPPRPSQAAPIPPALDAVVAALHGEDRRPALPDASRRSSRRCATRSASKAASPRSARGAAIYVEIRIADGADAESDEVLDDTSAILDATEQAFRGAGLTLPLQTGQRDHRRARAVRRRRAAAGERAAAGGAGERAGRRAGGRATAHARVHVNISVHVADAVVKDSAEAPGGKEIVGGELLSTADWAPQENVNGVHVTAAARA